MTTQARHSPPESISKELGALLFSREGVSFRNGQRKKKKKWRTDVRRPANFSCPFPVLNGCWRQFVGTGRRLAVSKKRKSSVDKDRADAWILNRVGSILEGVVDVVVTVMPPMQKITLSVTTNSPFF